MALNNYVDSTAYTDSGGGGYFLCVYKSHKLQNKNNVGLQKPISYYRNEIETTNESKYCFDRGNPTI